MYKNLKALIAFHSFQLLSGQERPFFKKKMNILLQLSISVIAFVVCLSHLGESAYESPRQNHSEEEVCPLETIAKQATSCTSQLFVIVLKLASINILS